MKNIKNKKEPATSVSKSAAEMNFFQKSFKWYKERRAKRKAKQKEMTFQETVISWVKTIVGAFIIVMIINCFIRSSNRFNGKYSYDWRFPLCK